MSEVREVATRTVACRPSWAVGVAEFEAFLATRPADARLDHVEDLLVAWAAGERVPGAIDEVARRIRTLTISHRRARVSDDTLEEARQRVLERMLVGSGDRPGMIRSYLGDGPLDGWLRVSLAREALSLDKRGAREAPWDDLLAPIQATTPEASYLKQLYETTYKRAFEAAAAELPPRERSILRQHLLLGMTIDRLGELYGVHRVTASRWILSAKDALLKNTRRHLQQDLKLSLTELEGLANLVESRLELSLERILKTDAGVP